MESAACSARAPSAVDTVAVGLSTPWDVAFLRDGGALVTERNGDIRWIDSTGYLAPDPWRQLSVASPEGSEIGLLGIDTGPSGEYVYVSATHGGVSENSFGRIVSGIRRRVARAMNPERGHVYTLSVHRFRVEGGSDEVGHTLAEGIAAGYLHGGGALRVGPDSLLYVTNGDAADHWRAQQSSSLRGKILRYTLDGETPPSNPFPTSPVFATGIRHVQGLAWHPETGDLLAIDHGPTGMESENGRRDDDELNIVPAGANLGWPIVSGHSVGGDLASPLTVWTPALAPAGLEIYRGPESGWHGNAFVTGLRGTRLIRVELAVGEEGLRVGCREALLENEYGRLRLVRQAPDGSLWVGTSNSDGRGIPRPEGDMILRLLPPGRD